MCHPCALLRKIAIFPIDGTWMAHGLDYHYRLGIPALKSSKNRYVPGFYISGNKNEYSQYQRREICVLQHYFWIVVIADGASHKLKREL